MLNFRIRYREAKEDEGKDNADEKSKDWLSSPNDNEAGKADLTGCSVQKVLHLLQTLYAIMEQSSPSSYRNGKYTF